MGSLLQALDSNFPHLQSGVATLRAGLLTFIDDLHHMDLEEAQNPYLADSWFWTRDGVSRCWDERFSARQQWDYYMLAATLAGAEAFPER